MERTVAALINHTLQEAAEIFMKGSPRIATEEEAMGFQGCEGTLWISDDTQTEVLGKKWEFVVMADLNSTGMEFLVAYEDGSTREWRNGNVTEHNQGN